MSSYSLTRFAVPFVGLALCACNHSKKLVVHDAGTDLSAASDLAHDNPDLALPAACNGSVKSTSTPGPAPSAMSGLALQSGFSLMKVASVGGARELAALPNGDLLVGTNGNSVYIVPNVEASGAVGTPQVFTSINDSPVEGVAFAGATCTIYVATQHGAYAIPYTDGMLTASNPTQIAMVRQGTPTPGSDGDVHTSSSVAYSGGQVYLSVGSGCNACVEVDATRATIQQMGPMGQNMTTKATRIRNAIAIAVNTDTGTVFGGGAGQDDLAEGHPYEFFDAVTSHSGLADYGWPACEENHTAYSDMGCASTVAPIIEFPAYSTLIGAAFYSASVTGAYAFPSAYKSGFFISTHGSWHKNGNDYYSPPRVAFVAMNGDKPVTPVNWTDPTKQWTEFVGAWQLMDGVTRIGRPSGVAVGPQGSLFVGDDQNGSVYRIRPQ
jgi:glucose/arabinose dehydrogenase